MTLCRSLLFLFVPDPRHIPVTIDVFLALRIAFAQRSQAPQAACLGGIALGLKACNNGWIPSPALALAKMARLVLLHALCNHVTCIRKETIDLGVTYTTPLAPRAAKSHAKSTGPPAVRLAVKAPTFIFAGWRRRRLGRGWGKGATAVPPTGGFLSGAASDNVGAAIHTFLGTRTSANTVCVVLVEVPWRHREGAAV